MDAIRPRLAVGDAGSGYTGAMRTMHWATAALLFGPFLAAWAIGYASDADADWIAMLHRSCGITILVTTLVRLAWRQWTVVPPLPADLSGVQRLAAKASVVALYVLLATQPLLGLSGSMLQGDPARVFGRLLLPMLLPINKPLAEQLFRVHGWTAMLLLAFIGAHVAAALHHHFIRRDSVLAGMLPTVLRRGSVPARRLP